MAKKYQAFPGMEDILPGEIEKWQWVAQKAAIFFESLGFKEIRTPILEPTDLFIRSIGQTTDIVHKEMYTFEDRGGRSMTMRPEMTASVGRSVAEHNLLRQAGSLRLYYIGPMFRAERPQAGRKRQFHQIGAEMVNETGVDADFDIIHALYRFLEYVGAKNPRLRLNDLSIINGEKKQEILNQLRDYFASHKDKLDKDSLYRLDKNVLRVFDSKHPDMQPIIEAAPWDEIAPLSDDFKSLTARLEEEGIPYEINRKLVRGLDYYTGCVFEISLDGLGAQDAVAGGGRYDELYGELGTTKAPCTGFSIGFERLLMALETDEKAFRFLRDQKVYLAPLDGSLEVRQKIRELALQIRELGFWVEQTPNVYAMKNHLKKANQCQARYMLLLGDEEFKGGECSFKDMDERTQVQLKWDELGAHLEGVKTL